MNENCSGVLWSLGKRSTSTLQETESWEKEGLWYFLSPIEYCSYQILGNAITWYRSEANMYRWLETFEQRHVEFQRYIRFCRSMSRIWTSSTNTISINCSPSESASLRARGLRQAAIFEDLQCLALSKFAEVAHPDFFNLEADLADLVAVFRESQLKWMRNLDIVRADLVRGSYKWQFKIS